MKNLLRTMSSYRPKVFVSRDDFPGAGINILKQRCELDMWSVEKGEIPREEFLKRVVGKDALLVCNQNHFDEAVISAAGPTLKVVSTVSVGVDHVDLNALKSSSIRLGHTPGVLTEAVAELTVTLLLATTRRILEANSAISRNAWKWSPTWMCGVGLAGSTVGIYGFRRIGQSVARKLVGFEVSEIIYSGPRRKTEGDKMGAVYVGFDELLKKSYFLIVLCPLTPETKGIFTREKFSLMKPNAVFVNTARGGIVDQDALVYALQNGLIRGAGLDVMTPEPLPPDHPLVRLENCVLTPHIGSATVETESKMFQLAVENLLSVFDGKNMPAEYIL